MRFRLPENIYYPPKTVYVALLLVVGICFTFQRAAFESFTSPNQGREDLQGNSQGSPTFKSSTSSPQNTASSIQFSAAAEAKGNTTPNKNNSTDEDELFCAAINPMTGTYVDLSQLSDLSNKPQKATRKKQNPPQANWNVRGWQYGVNFTMAICSSPVNDSEHPNTTGAYYMNEDKFVSIGTYNTTPAYIGKKLVLTYNNGDLCPNGVDRKSSLINFVCDRDIEAKAHISLVGVLHECSYFFEVRSVHACPTSYKKNDINVLGIFLGILLVFFAVEYGRRWFYRRMYTRFRRIPNDYMAVPESARPRWATVESEPRWRTFLRSLFERASEPHALIKLTTANRSRAGSDMLTHQSLAPSSSSLFREMEAQNNLLDSLDVHSSDS